MVESQESNVLIDPALVKPSEEQAPTPTVKATPAPQQSKKNVPDKGGFFWGTGRRKDAVARIRVKPGSGTLQINKRKLDEYFTQAQDRNSVLAPLKTTDTEKSLDVFANVSGGGTSGQAGAVMLGIARALKNYDENLAHTLRDHGYLTRDGRMVERKKPGQKGARKKFQFSKR